MARPHRLFVSHETLDRWLEAGDVEVSGDLITLVGAGQQFRVKSGVAFVTEVASGQDDAALIGRVKDTDQLKEMGAEHYADSVILGDNAYNVVEGFVGEPVARVEKADDANNDSDIELLSRFFMTR